MDQKERGDEDLVKATCRCGHVAVWAVDRCEEPGCDCTTVVLDWECKKCGTEYKDDLAVRYRAMGPVKLA